MKTMISILLLFVYMGQGISQSYATSDPDYIKYVKLGEAAMNAEKYDSCVTYYQQAFTIKQTSVLSTLRAAGCAYSLKDMVTLDYMLDTAMILNFDQAKGIFESFSEFEKYQNGPLHDDILGRHTQAMKDLGLDMELISKFDEIRISDQAQRQHMREYSEKYGWESPQMDSLWKLQNYSDSVNTVYISNLIDKHGYPGKSMVGPSHASTAFLVIQHADIDVQQKYLDIIKSAADEGELSWGSVALLVDRVNLRTGHPQIYGSQIGRDPETNEHYVQELADPENVDSLRATVGLPPLSSYTSNWDFEWDPERHRKIVAKVKAMQEEEEEK